MHSIITHGLYIFNPIFHCGLYCRAVSAVLQAIYVLNKKILQFLGLKSAVSNQERVIMARLGYIKSDWNNSSVELSNAIMNETYNTTYYNSKSNIVLFLFYFQQPETSRQADSGLLTTLISLGLRYGPTLFNLVMGGDEGGSSTSDKVSTDKIDNLDNQKV